MNVHLHGVSAYCLDIMGGFEIEPGQSLEFEWEVYAYTITVDQASQSNDTTFAAPGTYVLQVDTNVLTINSEAATIAPSETTFVVK